MIERFSLSDFCYFTWYYLNIFFFKAEANLKVYGKTLVNKEPDDTTELLKLLCSDYKPVLDKSTERKFSPSCLLEFLC